MTEMETRDLFLNASLAEALVQTRRFRTAPWLSVVLMSEADRCRNCTTDSGQRKLETCDCEAGASVEFRFCLFSFRETRRTAVGIGLVRQFTSWEIFC